MKDFERMNKLIGIWRGINRLHTLWITENPVRETTSSARVEWTARGRFLKIEYDWSFEDAVQEGLILVGSEDDEFKSFWIDSWHLGSKYLVSEGKSEGKAVSLKGFYAVPDHPDWGWRTDIEPARGDAFKITMYNVSPEGEESLAVEMEFQRQ